MTSLDPKGSISPAASSSQSSAGQAAAVIPVPFTGAVSLDEVCGDLTGSGWLRTTTIDSLIRGLCPNRHLVRLVDPAYLEGRDQQDGNLFHNSPFQFHDEETMALIPFCKEYRWMLLIVDRESHTFEFYDPHAVKGVLDTQSWPRLVPEIVQALPKAVDGGKFEMREPKQVCLSSSYVGYAAADSFPQTRPQQPNSDDCGVYVVLAALCIFASKPFPDTFDGALWRMIFITIQSGDFPRGEMRSWWIKPLEEPCVDQDAVAKWTDAWTERLRYANTCLRHLRWSISLLEATIAAMQEPGDLNVKFGHLQRTLNHLGCYSEFPEVTAADEALRTEQTKLRSRIRVIREDQNRLRHTLEQVISTWKSIGESLQHQMEEESPITHRILRSAEQLKRESWATDNPNKRRRSCDNGMELDRILNHTPAPVGGNHGLHTIAEGKARGIRLHGSAATTWDRGQ